jgi:hypothetical protein
LARAAGYRRGGISVGVGSTLAWTRVVGATLATRLLDEWRLRVRCGGAGHVCRPSAYPSIAGISPHCHEPPLGAKTGTRGLFLSDGNWDSFGDPNGAHHETSPPKFSASGRVRCRASGLYPPKPDIVGTGLLRPRVTSLPRGHACASGQQDKRMVDYDGDRLKRLRRRIQPRHDRA